MLSKIYSSDPSYPSLLKEACDHPSLLYYRGRLPAQNLPLLTVVGTRKISSYGREVMDYLMPPLIKAGIGIISGLAFGVDIYSHQLALKHGGYTAAVLASGADYTTPRSHERHGREIIRKGGGLLSEMPPGSPCPRGGFPRRNRILAAMTPMTLVIEAAQRSGSLVTARQALDYNREVAAVPGSVLSEVSDGTNWLIQQGAKAITNPDEILEFYDLTSKTVEQNTRKNLTLQEKQVLDSLKSEPIKLDRLTAKLKRSAGEILHILTMLEIKGLARNEPGKGYKLAKA